ncbi:MAG: hypothetical protein LBM75_11810 [Myxococcales bacterium]|nr:hypothetical protein [Myxococcales bacterium]
MSRLTDALFFDPADHELVELVNERLAARARPHRLDPLFDPYLHPRGIKVLAAPIHKRIAHAVVQLLATLEGGQAEERLAALRSLRDEVFMGCDSNLRHNTARVLLSIMKALIKEQGNTERQLRLAHDFFAALSGRPAVIRRELARYHLLEMPESWTQIAFDHHVHDANSKGRKSPSLLISDAWLKGIRELTVIYYGFIEPSAAAELTEAAEIMGVKLRIGIELPARFHDKYAQFIWAPRGFDGREDFLEFLEKPEVQRFFDLGRALADHRKELALAMLHSFNACHLEALNARFHVALPPLSPEGFLASVGVGQPSIMHLADYLHTKLLPLLTAHAEALKAEIDEFDASGASKPRPVKLDPATQPGGMSISAMSALASAPSTEDECAPRSRAAIEAELALIDAVSPGQLIEDYLRFEQNPGVPDPRTPTDDPSLPLLLCQTPTELVAQLQALHAGYRLTLNPTSLAEVDVLELLHDLQGSVTHVEIYNLKDRQQGHNAFGLGLMMLRRALGSGNATALKKAVRDILAASELDHMPPERRAKLQAILADIPRFLGFYRSTQLKTRIGSDSIGRGTTFFGMGLAVTSTLPSQVQRQLGSHPSLATTIPVRIEAVPVTRWIPRTSLSPLLDRFFRSCREHGRLRSIGYCRQETFETLESETRNDAQSANVISLSAVMPAHTNGFLREGSALPEPLSWHFLNTRWKNLLKILLGFIPAFLTFLLTKDWWLLTWFGALIWFGITGVRNVVQAVVSTGGLTFRSPFIKWSDLINWERVSDSLFYTGLSVPLLDWLVKMLLLEKGFGVTTQTSPLLLYSGMSLVNGLYIAAHNTYRGFPRAAVIGNLFRSVFAIPLALFVNACILELLLLRGWDAVTANQMLQLWAAIISKISSDMVAAIIEGSADRAKWLGLRRLDYRAKIAQLFDVYGHLEARFHDCDALELIASNSSRLAQDDPGLKREQRQLILSALDLLYFWMYQPRARLALRQLLTAYSPDERRVLLHAQRILEREQEISQMFLDQLVGKRFRGALACYLEKWPAYLEELRAMVRSVDESEKVLPQAASGPSASLPPSAAQMQS